MNFYIDSRLSYPGLKKDASSQSFLHHWFSRIGLLDPAAVVHLLGLIKLRQGVLVTKSTDSFAEIFFPEGFGSVRAKTTLLRDLC